MFLFLVIFSIMGMKHNHDNEDMINLLFFHLTIKSYLKKCRRFYTIRPSNWFKIRLSQLSLSPFYFDFMLHTVRFLFTYWAGLYNVMCIYIVGKQEVIPLLQY